MSISELTLFVASNSPECIPCIKIADSFSAAVRRNVNIVRLDTIEMRKVAANGKFFQITSVPTLVLFYEDGNLQLFLGAPKIIDWFNKIGRPKPVEPKNMYGPVSTSHPMGTRMQERDIPMYNSREEYYEEEIPERVEIVEDDFDAPPPEIRRAPKEPVQHIVVEDDYNEEEPEPVKPVRKSKSKKTKSKAEDLEKLPVDSVSEKRRIAKEKLNKAASAKGKPLSSRMKDVYNMAKQMEEDRTGSLGYKEDELPRY